MSGERGPVPTRCLVCAPLRQRTYREYRYRNYGIQSPAKYRARNARARARMAEKTAMSI